MIWAPFNDEAALLEEGLVLGGGERINSGNGGVSDGKGCPIVPGKTFSGGEGQKIVVTLGVPSGGERDGADRSRLEGVGGGVVLENLHVGTEFDAHVMVVRISDASDEARRAHCFRYPVLPRELVETADGVAHHVHDQHFGQPSERQTVGTGPKALLNRADGPFDFANVTVGGHDVEADGEERRSCALELVVGVHVSHSETSGLIQLDNALKAA